MNLKEHVNKSIHRAFVDSPKMRIESFFEYNKIWPYFFNNLCNDSQIKCLVVGLKKRYVSVSCLQNNQTSFVFIDDWSKGVKVPTSAKMYTEYEFLADLIAYRGANKTTILQKEYQSVEPQEIQRIAEGLINLFIICIKDVYGVISHMLKGLDKSCIVIIKNWNDEKIRGDVFKCFRDNSINIGYFLDQPNNKEYGIFVIFKY